MDSALPLPLPLPLPISISISGQNHQSSKPSAAADDEEDDTTITRRSSSEIDIINSSFPLPLPLPPHKEEEEEEEEEKEEEEEEEEEEGNNKNHQTRKGNNKNKNKNKKKKSASNASPRKSTTAVRRSTRRRILQNKDEDLVIVNKVHEEGGRGGVRKRKKTSTEDNLVMFMAPPLPPPSLPSSSNGASPRIIIDDENMNMDGVWEQVLELVMWKDVTKSTFWFGLGSSFFMSSSFSSKINFSAISAGSQLGILILGLAFFRDSFSQRQTKKLRRTHFQLTEDDFLRAARLVLPLANSVLAVSQDIFSGEPSMTLKVAPILLFMAKFGSLITPWRLFSTGFFLSFTIPKLYSSYSEKIRKKVEETKSYVLEAWKSCPRKKLVAASTATVLWNLLSVKMRIFAAFISVVAIRSQQQHIGDVSSENGSRDAEQQQTVTLAD